MFGFLGFEGGKSFVCCVCCGVCVGGRSVGVVCLREISSLLFRGLGGPP